MRLAAAAASRGRQQRPEDPADRKARSRPPERRSPERRARERRTNESYGHQQTFR
jgi:hypothetical protein